MLALSGMLSLIFYKYDGQLYLGLFILGSKFGVSQAFNAAYIGNVKLFPPGILSTTFGICNMFSRVITILAPFLAELQPDAIGKWSFVGAILLAFWASISIKF